ncbi:hypothetical protein D9M68_819650 [compost metagenome]
MRPIIRPVSLSTINSWSINISVKDDFWNDPSASNETASFVMHLKFSEAYVAAESISSQKNILDRISVLLAMLNI